MFDTLLFTSVHNNLEHGLVTLTEIVTLNERACPADYLFNKILLKCNN